MSSELLLEAAGRRRSPAAMPGHNAGQAPRNKGRVYPTNPLTVDEIVAVLRQTPPDRRGLRLRGADHGAVARRTADPRGLVGDRFRSRPAPRLDPDSPREWTRRREVGMNGWSWSDHLAPWLAVRVAPPVGALFCVIDGPTRGRPWSASAARGELRCYAAPAGVRRRFAPHQLRHAHAVELAHEGVPLPVIER